MWHSACQDLNSDLPEAVPLSFTDAAAYVATFEPLLFEEARESVRADWAEACEGARPRVWPADIVRRGPHVPLSAVLSGASLSLTGVLSGPPLSLRRVLSMAPLSRKGSGQDCEDQLLYHT
jgi:hypothetical protein